MRKILLGIDRDGTLVEDVKFLGMSKQWKSQIKLKKEVVDLLNYMQTKYHTTNIVISNQQGVARGYFDSNTVELINNYINKLLIKRGIVIDNWQYCPYVDAKYAASVGVENFKHEFISNKTKRKPNTAMLFGALKELNLKIEDFDKVVILGDSRDDEGLARNIRAFYNALYINVKNKKYEELRKELLRKEFNRI